MTPEDLQAFYERWADLGTDWKSGLWNIARRDIDDLLAEIRRLQGDLAAVTAERDAANRDKGYPSTAILQELPQELYLKVFDGYHKERGTYSSASPTYLPEAKDRNLAEAWAERDGDI